MSVLARFSKALAALGGSLVALLVAFGVDLTPEQTGALATFLTTLAVVVAPANATPAEVINRAGDGTARRLEARYVAQTDNGWQPGDPLDQPENPDPATNEPPV